MKNLVTLLVLGLVMFNCSPEPLESEVIKPNGDCNIVSSANYLNNVIVDITLIKKSDFILGQTDKRYRFTLPVEDKTLTFHAGEVICDINIFKKIIK